MSWGFTPLCRFGNSRYRLGATARPPTNSDSLSTTQCGVVSPHTLPPETSITSVVLETPQHNVSSQQCKPSTVRPQMSSASLSGSETSSVQSVSSNSEDRIVRRSPRLAQASRVSYRDDRSSESRQKSLSHWGSRVQEMWNNERNQNNPSQQSNPNYSVYNYDGQVTPCVNANATSSISVIYNNKHVFSNVSLLRYPNAISYNKSQNYPLNIVKSPPKSVNIKRLDFYEVVKTLIQKELVPEGMRPFEETYSFMFKADEVKNLLDKKKNPPYLVQLRFCKLDGSSEQNDYYPATHQVSVNHRFIMLPGLDTMPRGTMRPMDITHYCQLSPQACNFVAIRCYESCKMYVYIVQKYTSDDLLRRLEEKPHKKDDDTVKEIKKTLQDDDGIAAATLQFSLLCPLSRLRIKLPCRASTCNHLQCFDAATYLQLNECKPKWSCPVCYQPALYKNLLIDGYFKKVVDKNIEEEKIELHPDGTWTLVDSSSTTKKKPMNGVEKAIENTDKEAPKEDPKEQTVILDSDDDVPLEETSLRQDSRTDTSAPVVAPCRSNSPEVVTLSDDDSYGGDTPEVTDSTYPSFDNPSTTMISANAPSSGISITNDLPLFNGLWPGALGTIDQQQLADTYSGFLPMDQSRQLFIPLTRTPMPTQLPSGLTVTHTSNNELSSISGNHSYRNISSSKGKNRSQSASKTRKSKMNKNKNNSKKDLSDVVVNRKRRRILSCSSESSDSDNDSRSKSRSKSMDKKANKKKQKHKKSGRDSTESSCSDIADLDSDSRKKKSKNPTKHTSKHKKSAGGSSESVKSASSITSISSRISKSSRSTVQLISSSEKSVSNSEASSSSSSSSSESSDDEPENSDDSFTLKDTWDGMEESSRVLRSALRRHIRKK